MFKEGYNIHTQFPSLDKRKQNTPKLNSRREKYKSQQRHTQRTDHYMEEEAEGLYGMNGVPSNYEVKTEGHLPAIESLDGGSEYNDIHDGLTYSRPEKSVKSYRPHPLRNSSSRRNLKFTSVRVPHKSKFKTLYLVNLDKRKQLMQGEQEFANILGLNNAQKKKLVVPQEKIVRIVDERKNKNDPESSDVSTREFNIYDDSDAVEDDYTNVKKTLKMPGKKAQSKELMVRKLKTKIAKNMAKEGKISMKPGEKMSSGLIKKKFEESKEYKIVHEMMTDLNSVDQFRTIQKSEFLTRNPFEDDGVMDEEAEKYETEEEKRIILKEIHIKHQKAYIKHCKKYNALPLPLLKKIRYEKFVLKNYQLNTAVTRAFGLSMHHLRDHLKGVILCNNNMRDSEIEMILEGMKHNPITSIVIENNKLGPLSVSSLCKIV